MSLGFRILGHPLIDAGTMVYVVAAAVDSPSDLTQAHMDDFTQAVLLPFYTAVYMSNYIGAVILTNINFATPSINHKPQFDEIRRARLQTWLDMGKLDPHDRDTIQTTLERHKKDKLLPPVVEPADPDERCAFSGDPATLRISRIIIPMTGSSSAINFAPNGRPGLPLAGWVIRSLIALPAGTINSAGRALLVHTHDTTLLRMVVQDNLVRNQRDSELEGLKKRPNYRFARTHVIEQLSSWFEQGHTTAYPLSLYRFNSKSDNAHVEIAHLPSNVIRFLRAAQLETVWHEIISRSYMNQHEAPTVNGKGEVIHTKINSLYQDLFKLPEYARSFLSIYLLRLPAATQRDLQAPHPILIEQEFALISWPLIHMFMEMIMDVRKDRIKAIRGIADILADYIMQNDKMLYKQLLLARKPNHFRQHLITVFTAIQHDPAYDPPSMFDKFINAFFDNHGDYYRYDPWFTRDLILIGLLDSLRDKGFEDVHLVADLTYTDHEEE